MTSPSAADARSEAQLEGPLVICSAKNSGSPAEEPLGPPGRMTRDWESKHITHEFSPELWEQLLFFASLKLYFICWFHQRFFIFFTIF